MIAYEQILENFKNEPDCGVDAASDKGYWLEKADRENYEHLFTWREKVGLSPEMLSRLAPIPLNEYLEIERGDRIMTNGDAWRIDAAITAYTVANETWFQRSWKRGWLWQCRYRIRRIWKNSN